MRWRLLKTMYFQCMTEWISRSALLLFLKWWWNDCTLNSPDTSGFMKNVQRLCLVFTYKLWLWQKVNKHILSSYLKFYVDILDYLSLQTIFLLLFKTIFCLEIIKWDILHTHFLFNPLLHNLFTLYTSDFLQQTLEQLEYKELVRNFMVEV